MLLAWIPVPFYAVAAGTTKYRVSDGAFIAKTGWMTKHATPIDLYRVKSVSSVNNPFSGGRVLITNQDGSVQTFKLIRNAEEVASYIRAQAESERAGKNFKYREGF